MEPWWHRHPDALEAEKTGLDALGYSWSKNEDEWQAGRLVISVEIPHDGEALKLRAEYPATFPYFPPHAFLDGLVFHRHQHLVGKNLCLLAREGQDWRPGHDTLAVLLRDQFPKIQAVNAAKSSSMLIASHEDHVGEPFSSFLPYIHNCSIIVPDDTPLPEHSKGRLTLQVRSPTSKNADAPFVSGIVRTISDPTGKPLVDFPVTLPAFAHSMAGFWLRLPERPSLPDHVDASIHFYTLMLSGVLEFKKAIRAATRGQILVAGFVYPDEVTWRTSSDDWFFLAVRIQTPAKRSQEAGVQLQLVRADWGGEKAWIQRAPALRPLRTKTVLLIGLGSLGSPLSVHLARAGIGVQHLVDFDELQVGNTIRWALGWQYAGIHKAYVLAAHISQEYPYTEAHPHHLRIGAPYPSGELADYEKIHLLVEKADLIIDATANQRVSHFLADLARGLSKHYLWLTTTHGAAGGVVGRVLGRQGACWHCFQHSLADGSIALPRDAGSEEVQPGGCSQPTFIGAGIDSDEIALLAARLAVATLSIGEENGYPDFAWNAAVANLNRDGFSIAPDWTPYPFETNSACRACNPK